MYFYSARFTLPKWMEPNLKPEQMQQGNPNVFLHCLPCSIGWKTIQNQNTCSKVILVQWPWLFTLLDLLDWMSRHSLEKVLRSFCFYIVLQGVAYELLLWEACGLQWWLRHGLQHA
jgi:hypothetical protein